MFTLLTFACLKGTCSLPLLKVLIQAILFRIIVAVIVNCILFTLPCNYPSYGCILAATISLASRCICLLLYFYLLCQLSFLRVCMSLRTFVAIFLRLH